ncbi:putative inorganic phosphate cotransporter isoform X3 [Diorhabda sublineata]|uniref:putative inorganic phosphate cotransporter isoform X3 n=1 Tax=Diorhabda sublineata TaxID=1163346 RepID=UPI0024E07FAB|nr:putative inorganic phosphate cotransporter isoform X3 [Diorhabda sublineata]
MKYESEENKFDVTTNLLNQKAPVGKGPTFGKRHSQVIMLTFILICSFLMRTSLSVTIVAMTDPSASINKDIPRKLQVPWKNIFTSLPFFALMITNIAFSYTHWTMITETAIYLNKVMHFDLTSNSVFTSLPYIIELVSALIAAFIADYLLTKNFVTVTFIRKTANNIGLIVAAVSLITLTRIGTDRAYLTVTLVVLVAALQGPSRIGYIVNHMDLAPNFSGILMGFTNGSSVIASAFAPIFAYIIIKDETNVEQWNIIFYFSAAINIIACVMNSIFTTSERQLWNAPIAKTKRTVTSNDIEEEAENIM